jgi:hypothetical protein
MYNMYTISAAFARLTCVINGCFASCHVHACVPQDVKSDANQVADQAISLAKLVRAFAAEDWEKEHYDRYFINIYI